ncbi:MAG: HD domain-containing protein [candidate division Zixibacteria bacterium]|nr:HD domain-containing protein [candidate division Zixibacteria bacterium]
MKKLFVKDLKPGKEVVDLFVLRKKELKESDSKKRLELELGDKSGRIDAIAWDEPVQFYEVAEEGDVVKIEGWVGTYQGKPQIKLRTLTKVQASDFKLEDLLPSSLEDPDALLEKFKQKGLSIQNQYLKSLFVDLTSDVELMNKLKVAPAGKLWHHSYLGGLLEHTLRVTSLCELAAGNYDLIDRDLLVSGALLHDIGKITEYSVNGFIEYTDEGRLIGHIVSGDKLVASRIQKVDGFPQELALRLRHLVLSHQGKLECASPVVPKTIEAIVLHYADELDAKADAFTRVINKSKAAGKKWSEWVGLIDRYIYIGENVLEETEE